MNFRSVAQLADQVLAWSRTLPTNIDLVAGIPRSGMLAANLISLYRNIPLTDLDGLLAGRCIATGKWRTPASIKVVGGNGLEDYLREPRNVLIVDDSVGSGNTLEEVKHRVRSAQLHHKVNYGAVYVAPEMTNSVDYYCETINFPRVFEWNVLHHHILKRSCLDMDGVLCFDPRGHENDDGARYREFLQQTRPLLRPTNRIGYIVTSRLEKWREETETWLGNNEIRYDHLIMLDYPDQETRMHLNTYSSFKADVYRRTGMPLFIESNIRQAVEISILSRKPVLCTDTMQMIEPGSLPVARPNWPLADKNIPSLPRRLAHRVLPENVKEQIRQLRRKTTRR